MKTLMTMMLGLALVAGTASFTFAQDKAAPKTAKKGKGVCADKKAPVKGKCADGSTPTPAKAATKDKK